MRFLRKMHRVRPKKMISEGLLWGAPVRSNMRRETVLDVNGNVRLRSEHVMTAVLGAFHAVEMQDMLVRGVTYMRRRDGRVRVTVTAEVPDAFGKTFVRSIRIDIPRGTCPQGRGCADVSAMRMTPDPTWLKGFHLASNRHAWEGWLHASECPDLIAEVVLGD